jgi:DNA-binding GntR family transcriptional regulator
LSTVGIRSFGVYSFLVWRQVRVRIDDADGNGQLCLVEGWRVEGLEKLEPVNRETTPSVIAAQIRSRIMDGTFPPGFQLGEAQLAGRLHVSRGPVREAFQRLVQEGLLETRRNRGVFVTSLDGDDVADVYLARRAIEREAVTILTRRGDEAAFDNLDEWVDDMSLAAGRKAWEDLADADLRFHESLVRSSNSKRLQRMFSTLLVETRMCLARLESAYPVHARLVQEHRNLLGAMRQGDERAALDLIDAHLEDAVKDLSNAQDSA